MAKFAVALQRRKAAAKDAYKLTLRCLSTFDEASSQVMIMRLIMHMCRSTVMRP